MKQLKLIALLAILAVTACKPTGNEPTNAVNETLAWIGTATTTDASGHAPPDSLYLLALNNNTGELTVRQTVGDVSDPSYLAIHPNGQYMYVVERAANRNDHGFVSSFKLTNGKAERIGRVSSHGTASCHISVANNGKTVLVANYYQTVASYAILPDGSLSEAVSILTHHLTTAPQGRQETAHPHMILPGLDEQSAFVPDLGVDSVFHYRISPKGELSELCRTATAPLAGPRHMTFHTNKKWGYVLNELNRTVEVFSVKSADMPFERIQTIGTLAQDNDSVTAGAIHLHPSGKFLYTSNRGLQGHPEQSISVFSINEEQGTLILIGQVGTKGRIPRDFNIAPNGKFLLVANRATNTIVSFKVDEQTGQLSDTGFELPIAEPVCIKFM